MKTALLSLILLGGIRVQDTRRLSSSNCPTAGAALPHGLHPASDAIVPESSVTVSVVVSPIGCVESAISLGGPTELRQSAEAAASRMIFDPTPDGFTDLLVISFPLEAPTSSSTDAPDHPGNSYACEIAVTAASPVIGCCVDPKQAVDFTVKERIPTILYQHGNGATTMWIRITEFMGPGE